MAIILMLACIGMMIVGAFLIFKDRPGIGGALFMGGIIIISTISIFFGNIDQNTEAADRKSRTVVVFGAVIESNTTWTKEGGCVEVFTMTRAPYTFGIPCSTFQKPVVGNVMMVKFIQPKELNENPEVLEFYNITNKVEEVRFCLPSKLELPPAD